MIANDNGCNRVQHFLIWKHQDVAFFRRKDQFQPLVPEAVSQMCLVSDNDDWFLAVATIELGNALIVGNTG